MLSGRYGPYVNAGKVNANVPKGADPAAMTVEEAVKLLDERAAKDGGGKAKTSRRPPAASVAKSKAASKKATPKRSAGKAPAA